MFQSARIRNNPNGLAALKFLKAFPAVESSDKAYLAVNAVEFLGKSVAVDFFIVFRANLSATASVFLRFFCKTSVLPYKTPTLMYRFYHKKKRVVNAFSIVFQLFFTNFYFLAAVSKNLKRTVNTISLFDLYRPYFIYTKKFKHPTLYTEFPRIYALRTWLRRVLQRPLSTFVSSLKLHSIENFRYNTL